MTGNDQRRKVAIINYLLSFTELHLGHLVFLNQLIKYVSELFHKRSIPGTLRYMVAIRYISESQKCWSTFGLLSS